MQDFLGASIYPGDVVVTPERGTRDSHRLRYAVVSGVGLNRDLSSVVTEDGTLAIVSPNTIVKVDKKFVPDAKLDRLVDLLGVV